MNEPQSESPAWLESADGTKVQIRGFCELGRSAAAGVQLKSRDASRRHALIQPQGQTNYYLVDLGSKHGTYLNGHRVVLRKMLKDEDRLRMGSDELRFRTNLVSTELDEESETITHSVALSRSRTRTAWLLMGDIVGFSALCRDTDADSLAELVGRWMQNCRIVVEEQGGIVNKYLGDGFLAYWWHEPGTPALVRDALHRFLQQQSSAGAPFRVVLHKGEVILGQGASNGEECLLGKEVNFVFRSEKVAARLMEPLFVSEPAAAELAGALPLEPLEERHRVQNFTGLHQFHVPAGSVRPHPRSTRTVRVSHPQPSA